MKAIDILNKVDNYKLNSYSQTEKLGWLDELESVIYRDIITTHDNPDNLAYAAIDSADAELVAGKSDVYVFHLLSCIDLRDGDLRRYNNDCALFDAAYIDLQNSYNRAHMPLTQSKLTY